VKGPLQLLLRLTWQSHWRLAIGCTAAIAVLIARPIGHALTAAALFWGERGIDIVPALAIGVLTYALHYRGRSRAARRALQAARREAVEARRAIDHTQQLLDVSMRLATALDLQNFRDEVQHHLSRVLGDRHAWVAAGCQDEWEWVVEPVGGDAPPPLASIPRLLEQAVADGAMQHSGWYLFPLCTSEGTPGILGVQTTDGLTDADRNVLAALSLSIGKTLSNVWLFREMHRTATVDALTGCLNRSQGFTRLDGELRRARRSGRPLCVVMLDVDEFKPINDTHGHACGDALLAAIGKGLADTLRVTDIRCRYGGDEFLVILPDTSEHGAQRACEKLREQLESISVGCSAASAVCRVSIGMVQVRTGECDPVAVVHRADLALYADKRRRRPAVIGRNDGSSEADTAGSAWRSA
jgi:diguanylate cyclase (GGDEF)-like protein